MHNPFPSAPLSWPELPDEAAVALQDVLKHKRRPSASPGSVSIRRRAPASHRAT